MHPEGFLKELQQEHIKNPTLNDEDFESMMSKLRKLTFEEIQELQWGLHWLVGVAFFEQVGEKEKAKTEAASDRMSETEFSLSELIIYYWQRLYLITDPHHSR